MSGMRVYVGIDLGSTTTKAVILDDNEQVVGRGITNSRSNYDVACAIVRDEAFVRARFSMTGERMRRDPALGHVSDLFLPLLERHFRRQQHLVLWPACASRCSPRPALRATAPTMRSWRTFLKKSSSG